MHPGLPRGRTHGHFEIVEPLGQGGMGVVYKAIDTHLDRTVALKFLPPFLSADLDARERFVAEARAASTLDHPNICTVHEIGESDDGQVFIAMAYYEGETLDERMAEGALPVDEALGLARQIAQGLAKAHSAGIVHRDIKPANIIVTPDGIAKILDFGLAKLEDLGLTRSGQVLGTVKYMSPEHTGGDAVDARTDLWSVGVVMYEMLAGRHPFDDTSAAATMYGVLHHDPEPLTSLNPRVTPDVERIVAGCLVKDRERRYQSASELVDDLDRHGDAVDPVTGPRRTPPPVRKGLPRARRLAIGIGAAALLGTILGLPATRGLFSGGPSLPDSRYMAVLPLANLTGETSDDVLADGLTYSLTALLVGLGTDRESLLVVPASEIANQSITTAGEALQIFGVNAVLAGSFGRDDVGNGFVRLELVQPDPLAVVDNATLPGPEDPGFEIEVRRALGGLLGVGEDDLGRALAENQPENPQAYALYLQGLGYLRRQDLEGNLENAVGAFRRAIESDANYAVAYAGICEAQFELFRLSADTTYSNAALANCDIAGDLARDKAAVLTSLGATLLQTGEPERALRRLNEAVALDPDDADVHRWMGRYYEARSAPEEAERHYREAIGLRPDTWIYHNELAVLWAYNGQLEDARQRFDLIRTLTPDNYLAHNGLGFTSMMLGEAAAADAHFRESLARRPNPIAYRNLGYLRMRELQWDDAIEALETGLAISDSDWYSWRWLGHARYWNGDVELARAAWQRVVDVATPLSDVNPDEIDYHLGLAEAHVLLGEMDEGQRHLQLTVLRDFNWNYQPFYAGRLFEILGQREAALGYLEEAMAAGFDSYVFDTDPWLTDLRADPRWTEIRAAPR